MPGTLYMELNNSRHLPPAPARTLHIPVQCRLRKTEKNATNSPRSLAINKPAPTTHHWANGAPTRPTPSPWPILSVSELSLCFQRPPRELTENWLALDVDMVDVVKSADARAPSHHTQSERSARAPPFIYALPFCVARPCQGLCLRSNGT